MGTNWATGLTAKLGQTSSKMRWLLVLLTIMLAVYIAFFTNWFRTEPIGIHYRLLGHEPGQPLPSFILPQFALDNEHVLTHIRVTRIENGRQGEVMWEVTGESELLDQFVYGASLDGMQAVDNREAATLTADSEYELVIESNSSRGNYRFKIFE